MRSTRKAWSGSHNARWLAPEVKDDLANEAGIQGVVSGGRVLQAGKDERETGISTDPENTCRDCPPEGRQYPLAAARIRGCRGTRTDSEGLGEVAHMSKVCASPPLAAQMATEL